MKYYNKDFISVTWADCTLRKWLNQDFYIHAFDENEREQVLTSHLINDDNPDYGTAGGMETDDHVFILSYTEAIKYFKNDKDRRVKPSHKIGVTDYANNAHWIDAEGYIRWLIRTPGRFQNYVSGINANGSISTGYFNRVSNGNTGVATAIIRPAIRIELKSGQFKTNESYEELSFETIIPEPVTTETVESEQPEIIPETQPVKIDNPYAGVKVGDIIEFGHYEQDNDLSNGTEPIEWIVLEVADDVALLISEYGIDNKQYNVRHKTTTWETSSLRKWLNIDFFLNAFDSFERDIIEPNYSKNFQTEAVGLESSKDTNDRVFLLSEREFEDLFHDKNLKQVKATAYAITNGAWVSENGSSWWWLRGIGWKIVSAPTVTSDGLIYSRGRDVNYQGVVVRPCIRINLKKENDRDLNEDVNFDALADLKVGNIVEFGSYEQNDDFSKPFEKIK